MHQITVSKPWRKTLLRKKKKTSAFGYGFAQSQQCAQNPPFCKILAQDSPLTHSLPSVPNKCHLHAKRELGFDSLLRCENLVPTLTLDSGLSLNNLYK